MNKLITGIWCFVLFLKDSYFSFKSVIVFKAFYNLFLFLVSPVIETIYIPRTDRELTLTVLAYGTGPGVVRYSWDGIDPCPQDFAGCEPCETYVGNWKFIILALCSAFRVFKKISPNFSWISTKYFVFPHNLPFCTEFLCFVLIAYMATLTMPSFFLKQKWFYVKWFLLEDYLKNCTPEVAGSCNSILMDWKKVHKRSIFSRNKNPNSFFEKWNPILGNL